MPKGGWFVYLRLIAKMTVERIVRYVRACTALLMMSEWRKEHQPVYSSAVECSIHDLEWDTSFRNENTVVLEMSNQRASHNLLGDCCLLWCQTTSCFSRTVHVNHNKNPLKNKNVFRRNIGILLFFIKIVKIRKLFCSGLLCFVMFCTTLHC